MQPLVLGVGSRVRPPGDWVAHLARLGQRTVVPCHLGSFAGNLHPEPHHGLAHHPAARSDPLHRSQETMVVARSDWASAKHREALAVYGQCEASAVGAVAEAALARSSVRTLLAESGLEPHSGRPVVEENSDAPAAWAAGGDSRDSAVDSNSASVLSQRTRAAS
jgi:hypothetical protein